MAFIDCQMAHDTTKTEQGDVEMSCAHITSFAGHSILTRWVNTVAAWKHRFSSRCLGVVHEQAFGARPASYKAIQDLDKKVREFPLPDVLVDRDNNRRSPEEDMILSFQKCYIDHVKETSKLSFWFQISAPPTITFTL